MSQLITHSLLSGLKGGEDEALHFLVLPICTACLDRAGGGEVLSQVEPRSVGDEGSVGSPSWDASCFPWIWGKEDL